MNGRIAGLANTRFRRDTQPRCHGLIDLHDPVPCVQDRDQVWDGVKSAFPLLLRPNESLLGLLALGNFLDQAVVTNELAAVVAVPNHGVADPPDRLVLMKDPVFNGRHVLTRHDFGCVLPDHFPVLRVHHENP